MTEQHLFQIFLFSAVGLVFGMILLTLSLVVQKFFGIGRPTKLKNQEYECGVKPLDKSRIQFDIKYYVFALMFIVFDVEFVFLLPWSLSFAPLRGSLFTLQGEQVFGLILLLIEAFIFIAILGFGLYYAWRKGALEWE
ncbi:MAG: NADH-quinone oxidoreductase subunit A [Candidatus Caenarcaniphilales bacterium]|nr:NADH-quinone oxidoreductase subunit A [Candidatus Caenarcaniphilales bacterium]